MAKIHIYHNPRCSKSRQTLALIESTGEKPEIIEYLKQPPSVETLEKLVQQLNISVRELLRKGEPEYKSLQLEDKDLTDRQLLTIMHQYPRLIERPIVVKNGKACLGRPPENIHKIL